MTQIHAGTSVKFKVLRCLMDKPSSELSGNEIAVAENLWSGVLYPALLALEAAEWISSRWETEDSVPGRPRRRLYQITAKGIEQMSAGAK